MAAVRGWRQQPLLARSGSCSWVVWLGGSLPGTLRSRWRWRHHSWGRCVLRAPGGLRVPRRRRLCEGRRLAGVRWPRTAMVGQRRARVGGRSVGVVCRGCRWRLLIWWERSREMGGLMSGCLGRCTRGDARYSRRERQAEWRGAEAVPRRWCRRRRAELRWGSRLEWWPWHMASRHIMWSLAPLRHRRARAMQIVRLMMG